MRSAANVYWAEVVGADAREVDLGEDLTCHERGRGHLDHHPDGAEPGVAGVVDEPGRLVGGGDHRAPSPRPRRASTSAAAAARAASCSVRISGVAAADADASDAQGGVRLGRAGRGRGEACRRRRRACAPRPCDPGRRPAPRRRRPVARRTTARRCGRGTGTRCGTGRRPRSARRRHGRGRPRRRCCGGARPGGRRRCDPGRRPRRGRPRSAATGAAAPPADRRPMPTSTRPASASTATMVPSATPITPATGDDARQAQRPGQDGGVAGGPAALGDERQHAAWCRCPTVSAGDRSSAASTKGWPGSGMPGMGSPRATAIDAVADVGEVLGPLGQVAAGLA